MAVLLTISETVNGAAFSDALAGGGTGIDLGSVVSAQYAPITSQPANTGHQDIFIRHDGTAEITDVKTYLQQYGTGTGFTYGGGATAAADFTAVLNMGNTDAMGAGIANNSDGLGNGLHIDMDWDVSTANQFLGSRVGTFVRIYGDNGGAATGEGRNLATAITLKADAMSKESAGSEVAPSAAVDGKIGASGNATLGDRGHPRLRFFLASSETTGGLMQFEFVVGYTFTLGLSACIATKLLELVASLSIFA